MTASIWRIPSAVQRSMTAIEQCLADAEADCIVRDVDGVFNGAAIRRARAKLIGIGITGDASVGFGYQIR